MGNKPIAITQGGPQVCPPGPPNVRFNIQNSCLWSANHATAARK
jgi:hypothetical protein